VNEDERGGGEIMNQPTIEDLKTYQDELIAKFGSDTRIAVANVSISMFSVARHFGGCRIDGKYFVYNWMDDSIIREDVIKWITKRKKQEAKK
jgi:hypothetical protein